MKSTANVSEGQAGAEQLRDRQPQAARRVSESESMPASLRLRLWLPGYHTPSLNVTKGGHWKQYYGLKQEAAKVLLGVLKETPGIPARALLVVDGIAQGGQGKSRGGNRALLKAFGKVGRDVVTGRRGTKDSTDAAQRVPTTLKYTRVTCQPLDTENLCGSTKALTDCLVKAFPEWLPDDAPEFVEILHAQVRCGSKCEQGTWVELSAGGEPEISQRNEGARE